MNHLKKILFGLAVAVTLVLVGANTASAAPAPGGVAFQMSALLNKPVRAEGLAEAVGAVVLTSTSTGSIASGSTITLNYGTTIEAGTGAVATTCVTGTAPATLTSAVVGSVLTITVNGTTGTDFLGCTPGQGITITGVRVNANAQGAGTITATAGATEPAAYAASNPITFFIVNSVQVATIFPQATKTTVKTSTITVCNGVVSNALVFTVLENYPNSLTSLVDETAFGGVAGGVTNTSLAFVLTGIPVGVTVGVPALAQTTGTAGSLLPTTAFAGFTAAAGSQAATVSVAITGTYVGGVARTLTVTFPITSVVPATVGTGTAAVYLTGGAGTVVPRFVLAPAMPQFGPATAISSQICATYLLFPWVGTLYSAGGALIFDTGIAISNTSVDPLAPATTIGQTGAVHLFLFPINADGSPAAATAAPGLAPPARIASPLAPGAVAAFNVSEMVAAKTNFLGYIIAVCDFQLGHGTGFYTTPSAGGQGAAFSARVISNPRLGLFPAAGTAIITESAGN